MAPLYSFSDALKARDNGDDSPLKELIARVIADLNRPAIIGPVRPMRDDEDIRSYVEATMPPDEHLRERCRFLGIPYDREQIIRDRCWATFKRRQHEHAAVRAAVPLSVEPDRCQPEEDEPSEEDRERILDWSLGTVFEGWADDIISVERIPTPRELMDNAYEFICGICENEGTEPPSFEELLGLTAARLQEKLEDWIDYEVDDNGPFDDLRWARLCRAAAAAGLAVPNRPTG